MNKNEKLLDELHDATVKLHQDRQYESADPNRESSTFAQKKYNAVRDKVLKRMK